MRSQLGDALATGRSSSQLTELELVREDFVPKGVDEPLEPADLGLLLDDVGFDLLDLRPLIILQLRHLALDPLDVGLGLLVLRLGFLHLVLQFCDRRLELLDLGDDLFAEAMSVSDGAMGRGATGIPESRCCSAWIARAA